MAPVGLPDIAWMPPYVAQVPTATIAVAFGRQPVEPLARSCIGWPVAGLLPNAAQ